MNEDLNKKVSEWMELAEGDRVAAKSILKHDPEFIRPICFHAQQLAEKALKAFLCANSRHIEKIHDLTRILTACAEIDPEFSSFRFITDELTPYAVAGSYPDDSRPIARPEAVAALENADRIYEFVRSKLDPSLTNN